MIRGHSRACSRRRCRTLSSQGPEPRRASDGAQHTSDLTKSRRLLLPRASVSQLTRPGTNPAQCSFERSPVSCTRVRCSMRAQLKPPKGLEPLTSPLPRECSTTELRWRTHRRRPRSCEQKGHRRLQTGCAGMKGGMIAGSQQPRRSPCQGSDTDQNTNSDFPVDRQALVRRRVDIFLVRHGFPHVHFSPFEPDFGIRDAGWSRCTAESRRDNRCRLRRSASLPLLRRPFLPVRGRSTAACARGAGRAEAFVRHPG